MAREVVFIVIRIIEKSLMLNCGCALVLLGKDASFAWRWKGIYIYVCERRRCSMVLIAIFSRNTIVVRYCHAGSGDGAE